MDKTIEKNRWWRWVCEFCFKQTNAKILPQKWRFIWQSAVCPACHERVLKDGGYNVVCGGSYAGKRRDPRATP